MSDGLPEAAGPAWEAYRAMEASKLRYFGLLQEVETKAERGLPRTLAERMQLEQLLAEHDRQVARFREAVKALMSKEPEAHAALVERLRLENEALGSDNKPH